MAHPLAGSVFPGLRCSPGEDLDEELLIDLGQLSCDCGHEQLFGHGVEESKVSGGVCQ